MTDVWFYHLERHPLEFVLPRILAGMYARGDRICVHASNQTVLEDLSQRLWKLEDTAFIPHGFAGTSHPIIFTCERNISTTAPYRFFIDGMFPEDIGDIARAAIFFNGSDESHVAHARQLWKKYRAADHAIKYWKQSESGRWEDQALKAAA